MRVLSPIQMARVFMASFPYNPGKPLPASVARVHASAAHIHASAVQAEYDLAALHSHASACSRHCALYPPSLLQVVLPCIRWPRRLPFLFLPPRPPVRVWPIDICSAPGCSPSPADMTRICPWLFARPSPQQQHYQQHLPWNGAPGHFLAPMQPPPAFATPGQEFGPAVPAGSQVHSMPGIVPVGAADVAGADLAPGPPDLARARMAPGTIDHASAGLAPGGPAALEPGGCPDPDSLLDLLNDEELDFLIADLAGDDEGHFLAASSPHLP